MPPIAAVDHVRFARGQGLARQAIGQHTESGRLHRLFPRRAAPLGTRKLYEDKDLGFVVLAHCNPKPHKSPPHDHGASWAVYGQAVKYTDMSEYKRLDGGTDAGDAKLEKVKTYRLEPGHAGVYDVGAIHAIDYPDGSRFVRVTGRDLDYVRRLKFDMAAGKAITGLTPTWSFSPGQGQIDADGAFVGYEPGDYTITASFGARSVESTITLAPRDVRRPLSLVGRLPRTRFTTEEVWIHPDGKHAYLGSGGGGDKVATPTFNPPGGTYAAAVNVTLATSTLQPWSHWVTPLGLHKRFDTLFFVAPAPPDQLPEVDAGETTTLAWVQPQAALAAHGDGAFVPLAGSGAAGRALRPVPRVGPRPPPVATGGAAHAARA